MSLCLQISGKPRGVEPVGVVDTTKAQHHSPDGPLSKQRPPGVVLGCGGLYVTLAKGGVASGAMECDPCCGDNQARDTEGNEQSSPTDGQHQPREKGGCDREAERLRHAHNSGSASAGVGRKPLAHAAYA